VPQFDREAIGAVVREELTSGRRAQGRAVNQPALVAPRPGDDALERRLARVCGFVDAYLDVVLDDDSDRAAKAACEVALFARHLGMLGVRVDWARAIGARLVPRLRGVGVIQRLVWTPSRAGMLGVGHALLRDLGLPDPAWDRVIDRLTRHALAECRELSPYEALEIDWMLGLLGGAPRPGPRGPTAIERAFDPLAMLSDDAYAFTHAVFYATDFGRRPLPAEAAAVVADRADAGAAWSLARGDYDLIGEFVLAARGRPGHRSGPRRGWRWPPSTPPGTSSASSPIMRWRGWLPSRRAPTCSSPSITPTWSPAWRPPACGRRR
jgi:hypothetical protein